MLRELLYVTVNRFTDWATRARSVGVALLKYGVELAVGAAALDLVVQVARQAGEDNWSFSVGSGQGIPAWLTLTCVVAGLLLAFTGTMLLVVEHRREQRRRLVVIELRGLHTSPDTPAVDKVVPAFRGDRRHLLVDFRPQGPGALVDPNYLLERVSSMKGTLKTLVDGADRRDVQVAAGGLAAVPALVLAGILLDDESNVHIFDWDRSAKIWRAIDGPDDSERFLPFEGLDGVGQSSEVVLVVEASYAINQQDVVKAFGAETPVLRLRIGTPLADRFWSEQKQRELTVQFRDALQLISAKGVTTIHLLLAAPASLSLRMGMSCEKRLLPGLVVHQFERSSTIPYPWGIQLPVHGQQLRVVHRPALAEPRVS